MIAAEDVKQALERFNVEYASCLPVGQEFYLVIDDEQHRAVMVDKDDADDQYTQRIWFVFELDGRMFIRYGRYQSHYGEEWEYGQFEEVNPVEVTETAYRPLASG